MRIVRLALPGEPYGRVQDDTVHLLSGPPWLGGGPTGQLVPLDSGQLLAPVVPSKIVAIGRNYAAHAKELGHDVPSEPLLFLKAPSAIVGPGAPIRVPSVSARVEHEAELALVIGKRCKRVAEAQALEHVFGWTVLNDVTARDLQKKDVQFTRSKSFDTFCPVGPWIETSLDVADVEVSARVDGVVRQRGRTRNMIFPVPMLISYVSCMMTLEPGDVITTGTPEGVGPLVPGNVLETAVEGIGVLRNPIVADDES
ncbi:MAG: fumarylacetoacetate hydrolase family protein [Deltaproteobacteria bacterium]|nr:fumarylacetoacetate hydrolase family protein [Deltaproteobacteria bacterium]